MKMMPSEKYYSAPCTPHREPCNLNLAPCNLPPIYRNLFPTPQTFLITISLILSACFLASAQNKLQQKIPEKTRILFLLDGSGSMLENWGRPNQTKMSIARSILTKIVDSLQQNSTLELGLRIYGHRSPREANNCKDSWLEVPFKANNHKLIIEKIHDIKPKGVTPITYSLEQAAHDFPESAGYRNIVILITDGIESCGGDPCAASRELQKKGVFLRPYIIGLGMRAEKSLDCAGKFIDADTPGKFHDILNEAIEATFAKTTVSIELLGANNKPTETNINITFINSFTGLPTHEFVHYRDLSGKPDSVQVDPLIQYEIVVNTVPPVIEKNVNIIPGKHNVFRVAVPQGNLVFQQQGKKNNSVQAVVRLKGIPEILNTQQNSESFRYLTGKYELETLTMPRRIFTVDIQPDKTQTVTLPGPATVNFNTTNTGYGSLYEIKPDGTQQWVCNLNELKHHFTLSLLPGQYKIVFRVKNTTGSKYTAFKIFTVKSGETALVNVF